MNEESLYGWDIKVPKEKKVPKNKKKKKKTYPEFCIGVGIFSFLFGMLIFLDGWWRYNNPFFPFASETIKQEIVFEILFGLFFVVVGLAMMIKGFIDYAKEKE